MATLSPSPTSPLAVSPTSAVISPPESSTPIPDSPSVINANPPDPSTAPPPSPVASPSPASPPPVEATLSPPPPAATLPPPAPAASPPPPTAIPSPPPPSVGAPPPSASTSPVPTTPAVSPPPPTTATPPLASPPPPSIPPSSKGTPDVPSPPFDPTSSPPPPTTKPKSPTPSTLRPTHSSPPPPASNPQSPVSESPPPPLPRATHPPPPSTSSPRSTPSAPQPPGSTHSPPSQEPPNASPSPHTVSLLSPPPPVSPSPGSSIHSSVTPIIANPSKGGLAVGGVVAIGLVVGVILLGLIGLVVFCMSKRRRRTSIHNGGYIVPSPYGSSPRSDLNLIVKTQASSPFARSGSGSGALSPHSHGGLGQSRSWFVYQELFEATGGFALENLLGEGGFGLVYKGVLANGREVAVKHLKVGGSQGEREFQAEVETISRIHHRHLVSLVGYCMSESKRLLVYEYVPNQTLYYHLHGENRPVFDWATRIKIAEGAARGIAYLHEDCHPRIIHRDIKSSNILLDTRFEARVSDFGLAKLALDAESHVSTRVMGTFGYMAPEYATSGKLTDKSDVYSFGVVLLELITGRKPVDESQPMGDESLVEWARPLLSHALHTGQVEGLVDPRLEKSYVESELFLMIEAAAACVRHLATKRPRMGQVVRAFDGRSPSDLSNGMRFGQSEIYDSAQQSAEIRWFRRMAFGSHEYSTDYFSEAIRNTESVNPNQNDQGAVFSTQQGRNDPSQSSQNIYFSSQRTQSPAFSGQWSQNPSLFRQSSQNPIPLQHSSYNAGSSGRQNQSS